MKNAFKDLIICSRCLIKTRQSTSINLMFLSDGNSMTNLIDEVTCNQSVLGINNEGEGGNEEVRFKEKAYIKIHLWSFQHLIIVTRNQLQEEDHLMLSNYRPCVSLYAVIPWMHYMIWKIVFNKFLEAFFSEGIVQNSSHLYLFEDRIKIYTKREIQMSGFWRLSL